jgi:hypothetical protein
MQLGDVVYLPFWVINYALAIVMWSCVGRFVLSFLLGRLPPAFYINRAFVWLTQWWVATVRYGTPGFIHPIFLPLIAAFWMVYFRIAVFIAMYSAGMIPPVGAGGS